MMDSPVPLVIRHTMLIDPFAHLQLILICFQKVQYLVILL